MDYSNYRSKHMLIPNLFDIFFMINDTKLNLKRKSTYVAIIINKTKPEILFLLFNLYREIDQ